MIPNVHPKRSAALVGLVGLAVAGAVLLTPAAAQAKVASPPHASQPGSLTLSPASGDATTKATWSTTTACPSQHNAGAYLAAYDNTGVGQQISRTVTQPGTGPIQSKPMLVAMGAVFDVLGPAPDTFEFAVVCEASLTSHVAVQSTFVTVKADGTWTASATPPGGAKKTSGLSVSSPIVWVAAGLVVLVLVGGFFGVRSLRSRRARREEAMAAAMMRARQETVEQLRKKAAQKVAAREAGKGGSG